MNKKVILQLSLASACLWVASLDAASKPKVEKFVAESAVVLKEKVEIEGKKPKMTYYLEVDGKKIMLKDVKKVKQLVGKTVSIEGKGLKEENEWSVITKIDVIKELKI